MIDTQELVHRVRNARDPGMTASSVIGAMVAVIEWQEGPAAACQALEAFAGVLRAKIEPREPDHSITDL